MKYSLPKYLDQTDKALSQLFDGIEYYNGILKSVERPVFITETPFENKEQWESEFDEWHSKNKKQIEQNSQAIKKYIGYSVSKGILSGSILQIATTAIDIFSKNEIIPDACSNFIKPKTKAVKFCIGRTLAEIPIGLIIHAGRNHYNHWNDENPHKLTKKVFSIISRRYGDFDDPAFDLKNEDLDTYSHNIIALLNWKDKSVFVNDLESMLQNVENHI